MGSRYVQPTCHKTAYKRMIKIFLLIFSTLMLNSCNSKTNENLKAEDINLPPKANQKETRNGMVYFSYDNGLNWIDSSNGLPEKIRIGLDGIAASSQLLGIAAKDNGVYIYNFNTKILDGTKVIDIFAKWTMVFFGLFFICVGFLMLIKPKMANDILRKAGSTNFINYAEITIRIIPAVGLILSADNSKFPEAFKVFGWFMLLTSLVLYFVPPQLHHSFSVKAADILKPLYFQLISPFAILIGVFLIYNVM